MFVLGRKISVRKKDGKPYALLFCSYELPDVEGQAVETVFISQQQDIDFIKSSVSVGTEIRVNRNRLGFVESIEVI